MASSEEYHLGCLVMKATSEAKIVARTSDLDLTAYVILNEEQVDCLELATTKAEDAKVNNILLRLASEVGGKEVAAAVLTKARTDIYEALGISE